MQWEVTGSEQEVKACVHKNVKPDVNCETANNRAIVETDNPICSCSKASLWVNFAFGVLNFHLCGLGLVKLRRLPCGRNSSQKVMWTAELCLCSRETPWCRLPQRIFAVLRNT